MHYIKDFELFYESSGTPMNDVARCEGTAGMQCSVKGVIEIRAMGITAALFVPWLRTPPDERDPLVTRLLGERAGEA